MSDVSHETICAVSASEKILPDVSCETSKKQFDYFLECAIVSFDKRRRQLSRSRIIAVANQKGGVGKTTTSINLAACLAELGNRVLVVDMDPQANATTGLGVDPKHVDRSVYNVLLDNESISNITEATAVGNLLIAPSSLSLASAEIELFNVFKREQRLDLALQEAKAEYDFIFIDCPPTLGLLTINAFSAAKEVMLPIQCEYFALEGVAQLTHAMSEIQVHLNPDLAVSLVILVMYDARANLSHQVEKEVRKMFKDLVSEHVVPRSVKLAEAPSQGLPITLWSPASRGALAYKRIAKEIAAANYPQTNTEASSNE